MTRGSPGYWNIWWTLALVSAAVTIVTGILEILGVWHDVGTGVGLVSMTLTLLFGLQGATERAVRHIDHRLAQMHDTLQHILLILDKRLPDATRHP